MKANCRDRNRPRRESTFEKLGSGMAGGADKQSMETDSSNDSRPEGEKQCTQTSLPRAG
jgi:hypothetical protein